MGRFVGTIVLSVILVTPQHASAHCDTMGGPVITTAQKALESGDVAPVLAWVQAGDETEIREAFQQAAAVRKLGHEASALADRFFLETVVRIHRAGEGASFTGLKPEGSVKDPALEAADKAVETGKLEPVAKLLVEGAKAGLSKRFAHLRALKPPGDDVAEGREWVEAYVSYVHYVLGVYQAIEAKAGAHQLEGSPASAHHDE